MFSKMNWDSESFIPILENKWTSEQTQIFSQMKWDSESFIQILENKWTSEQTQMFSQMNWDFRKLHSYPPEQVNKWTNSNA